MRLALVRNEDMGDWYTIERAEHDGREWLQSTGRNSMSVMRSARISDADVEGTAEEMLGIAEAIEKRGTYEAKRCAVAVGSVTASFWSPRNSQTRGTVSLAEADELAAAIRAGLSPSAPTTADRLASLTDAWLCRAVNEDDPGVRRAWAIAAAEVRELLPEGTRYDNG